MAESFNALYCCVHCLITRDQIKTKINLDDIIQRTNDNFYKYLNDTPTSERNPQVFLSQTKGVYRNSELSRLKFMKVPGAISADTFHDIEEGFGKDLLHHVIYLLTESGKITRDEIFERIFNFNYGVLDIGDKPTNSKHFSGVQIRNLLFRFNFIFWDKADYTFFEATSVMSKILQIVYSNTIKNHHITILRSLIERVKEIWHIEWGQIFKPKPHIMSHYPDLIEKNGPLVQCNTAAYEMHHKVLTRVVAKNPQFVNILKSCAERHQVAWSKYWQQGKFHDLVVGKGKMVKIQMNGVIHYPQEIDWSSPVYEVKKAKYIYTYAKDLYIVNGYNFLRIQNVIVFAEAETIYLKCKELDTEYVSFFAAHKIKAEKEESIIINVADLKIKETFAEICPFAMEEKYILCKRNVI